MKPSRQPSRVVGVALPVFGISALTGWAIAHATTAFGATVALVGVVGIVIFGAALTTPLAQARSRTVATGLALVGTALVVSQLGKPVADRATVFAISGAILFCAAELADGTLDRSPKVEHRPGVERWNPTLLLGVSLGAGGLSYGAIASRGLLADGGPPALVAGTAAAVLVAFLASLLLRTRARHGT